MVNAPAPLRLPLKLVNAVLVMVKLLPLFNVAAFNVISNAPPMVGVVLAATLKLLLPSVRLIRVSNVPPLKLNAPVPN